MLAVLAPGAAVALEVGASAEAGPLRHARPGAEALARHGDRRLELVDLSFRREREAYDRFALHRGAELTVRRPDAGETVVLEILDVFVEWRGGRWKLMDYDD